MVAALRAIRFQRRSSFTKRGMGATVKECAIGEGMLADESALKLDPSAVKKLESVECVVIAGGPASEVICCPAGPVS